jgi:DNA invertase Pin-like site-specific DNA recombinase
MARKSRKAGAVQTAPENREAVFNTALYVRLSIMDSGKKDGESILNQQEMLEQYIASRPELTLKAVFIDNGETGVDFLRPAWNDLMAECRAGKINCIVLKDLSRLGRNYIETSEYLETIFPALGIRLIAVNDSYDNISLTSGERLVANLKNLVNDIYAKDISRKVSSALHTKQKNGEFIGNYAAYGYLKDSENKNCLVVDLETAPVVRQIFQWKSEGAGSADICRRLNGAGILSPNRYRLAKGIIKDVRCENTLWQIATLKTILQNTVYLGNMAQGKHIGSLCEGKPRSRAKSKEWVTVEGTHEPIITQELFDLARMVIDNRTAQYKSVQGRYAHFENPEVLLKGLVFCADCGRPLFRYKSVTGHGKYCDWIYQCRTSETLQACPKKYVHELDLNGAVYEAICLEIQKSVDVSGVIDKLNRESSHKSRLARFDSEIEETEREIKRIVSLRQAIYEDYAAKLLTLSEYKFATEKYNADSEKQQCRLETAKREQAEYAGRSTPINKWLAAFTRFMDAKELTAVMAQTLIERVEVSGRDRLRITFKFRDEFAEIQEYAEVAA